MNKQKYQSNKYFTLEKVFFCDKQALLKLIGTPYKPHKLSTQSTLSDLPLKYICALDVG